MARRGIGILTMVGTLLLAAGSAWGEEGPVYAPDGVAIHGYDPVAYFTEEAAVPGDPANAYEWSGATWHFASRENLELFAQEPEKYAPQYGGYCAWAVSRGSTARIDPEQFVVEDGRLFLNFSRRINRRFVRDLQENIRSADQNWTQVRESVD